MAKHDIPMPEREIERLRNAARVNSLDPARSSRSIDRKEQLVASGRRRVVVLCVGWLILTLVASAIPAPLQAQTPPPGYNSLQDMYVFNDALLGTWSGGDLVAPNSNVPIDTTQMYNGLPSLSYEIQGPSGVGVQKIHDDAGRKGGVLAEITGVVPTVRHIMGGTARSELCRGIARMPEAAWEAFRVRLHNWDPLPLVVVETYGVAEQRTINRV